MRNKLNKKEIILKTQTYALLKLLAFVWIHHSTHIHTSMLLN